MQFIIYNHADGVAFGPFNSQNDAEEWLAKQEIYVDQYHDQEVEITEFRPITEKLKVIVK